MDGELHYYENVYPLADGTWSEGDDPAEDPAELIKEAAHVLEQIEVLVRRINHTNSTPLRLATGGMLATLVVGGGAVGVRPQAREDHRRQFVPALAPGAAVRPGDVEEGLGIGHGLAVELIEPARTAAASGLRGGRAPDGRRGRRAEVVGGGAGRQRGPGEAGELRAAVLVPWAIPTAVTAKLWAFIFADRGIANGVLDSLFGTTISWTK